jgi:hypothetical protein
MTAHRHRLDHMAGAGPIEWTSESGHRYLLDARMASNGELLFDLSELDDRSAGRIVCSNVTPQAAAQIRAALTDYLNHPHTTGQAP